MLTVFTLRNICAATCETDSPRAILQKIWNSRAADRWGKFVDLFWTLHAWVYEYNPVGVFSPNNARMP